MPPNSQSSRLTAGIDIGTTAVKAVLVDDQGHVVGRSRVPSALHVGPDGLFEHDAEATWRAAPRRALAEAVSMAAAKGPSGTAGPAAVAVSAMMSSVAAVDAAGRPQGPGLLYGDSRGADPGATGTSPMPVDPLANPEMGRFCQWLSSSAPGAGAAGYWPAQAVANASLGGAGVVDLATAFACGPMYNGSEWDAAVCATLGLFPSQLPKVAVFGEALGDVAGAGGGHMVLAAGSVDGLCEQMVAGASEDGDVLIGLGSTLVVWLTAPGWPDEVPGLWRVPHLVGGKAMVGGASNAGGLWAGWARQVFAPGQAKAMSRGQLLPAGVPMWYPWARGERVPWHDPSLTVSLRGADMSQGPAALMRAAYEATGFVVRSIVERAAACGTKPRRFIVSGGGVSDRAWLQAIADVLGHPILPLAVPESAAQGAAFLARMALGYETSLDDARRWAVWSPAVEPDREWAMWAGERYARWYEGLPGDQAPSGRRPS